ncbi:hypothetical protein HBH50_224870 [Parastagonospora nodorum]|nr:hypothetical protein HBH50_224870 [Parastagonospora nodorum]KAH4077571.1 hypothetical protein HBH48_241660 [Parastagonospora nodorum]
MLPTALLLTFLAAGQVASSDTALNINIDLELTAVTTSGTYTGFVDDAAPNVKQWLGIRYGKAPVGRKRFMPPEPSVDMTTHYYAREYKPICFQQSGNHTGLFWELVPEFQNQDPQSEDCLYLNVWAPKKPAKKVPVLIWFRMSVLPRSGPEELLLLLLYKDNNFYLYLYSIKFLVLLLLTILVLPSSYILVALDYYNNRLIDLSKVPLLLKYLKNLLSIILYTYIFYRLERILIFRLFLSSLSYFSIN